MWVQKLFPDINSILLLLDLMFLTDLSVQKIIFELFEIFRFSNSGQAGLLGRRDAYFTKPHSIFLVFRSTFSLLPRTKRRIFSRKLQGTSVWCLRTSGKRNKWTKSSHNCSVARNRWRGDDAPGTWPPSELRYRSPLTNFELKFLQNGAKETLQTLYLVSSIIYL